MKRIFVKKLFFISSLLSLSLNIPAYAQNTEVFEAISEGDLNYVQNFLDNGGDVNTTGFRGRTLLHSSISFNQTQIAVMLIEAGADINKPEKSRITPLYLAFMKKNQPVTQALLERNAVLNAKPDPSKSFHPPPINLAEIVSPKCISDSYQTWINANTHSEFLPYIEKYLSIKEEFTGQREFNYPIKILFYRSDSEVWRQFSRLAQKFTLQGASYTILINKHIVINYDAWMSFSETTKELTIFHELGHADLNRAHTLNKSTSIMSPAYNLRLFSQEININEDPALKQELHEELFSRTGILESNYIEGQVYLLNYLSSDDPNICPVKATLYLDETNTPL